LTCHPERYRGVGRTIAQPATHKGERLQTLFAGESRKNDPAYKLYFAQPTSSNSISHGFEEI
jgi:hypothetical protein